MRAETLGEFKKYIFIMIRILCLMIGVKRFPSQV